MSGCQARDGLGDNCGKPALPGIDLCRECAKGNLDVWKRDLAKQEAKVRELRERVASTRKALRGGGR